MYMGSALLLFISNTSNSSRSAFSDIKREVQPSVLYLIKHELRVFR